MYVCEIKNTYFINEVNENYYVRTEALRVWNKLSFVNVYNWKNFYIIKLFIWYSIAGVIKLIQHYLWVESYWSEDVAYILAPKVWHENNKKNKKCVNFYNNYSVIKSNIWFFLFAYLKYLPTYIVALLRLYFVVQIFIKTCESMQCLKILFDIKSW